MKTVNTVLWPLETTKIGFALMHDHIMGSASGIPQVYPELLGKDYKERIIEGLTSARQAGINTIVDADTFDLGRAQGMTDREIALNLNAQGQRTTGSRGIILLPIPVSGES